MATLVFSALGTALGGPLGGALGALLGNRIDRTVAGSSTREGPRLRELGVTASSYGTPIFRHFGRVRAPGVIIWSTELKEIRESSGGSKGSPSIATYAYSASFAIAIASRPIKEIGRIWADGNLLRGSANDLKVGGQLRIYNGHGDQLPDPLMATQFGLDCPAYRFRAYCVFEDLQLGTFGNRIPSLTFEVVADDGPINIAQLLSETDAIDSDAPLVDLIGFSDEGGPVAANLATIDQLYPTVCAASGGGVQLRLADEMPAAIAELPGPSVAVGDDEFGRFSGRLKRRVGNLGDMPDCLRYYDVDRDFQPGLQRAERREKAGRTKVLEFPGALHAVKARELCNSIFKRASWSGDQLLWRIAQISSAFLPGQLVSVPGYDGVWRIENWEWRTEGIELELIRLPPGRGRPIATDPGAILAPKDVPATPTALLAFELPWSGTSSPSDRQIHVAVSSSGDGWTGAALYAVEESSLRYLRSSGSRRSIIGYLTTPLAPSKCVLLDRESSFEVKLVSPSFLLHSTNTRGLAEGLNRVLVGEEVLQFGDATQLGNGNWRLTGLARGRGGTEAAAMLGHASGAGFVLLDANSLLIDATDPALSSLSSIAAIGLADDEPVIAEVINMGLSQRPVSPVHPVAVKATNGSVHLSWVRRARGAWRWPELGEVPKIEDHEQYLVGIGSVLSPDLAWETSEPQITLAADVISMLRNLHLGKAIWVREVGNASYSEPVFLMEID